MASSKELLARENATLRLRVSELEAGANLDKGIIYRLRQRVYELETKPSSSEPSSYANRVDAQEGRHISKKYGMDEHGQRTGRTVEKVLEVHASHERIPQYRPRTS